MAKNTDSGKVKMTGEEFFEKNQKVIGIAMLAIIVVVGGIFLMRYMKTNKNADAQADIFQAQYYFEQDSLDLALNGDGRSLGFVNIIEIYSNTEAANLSNFYAGAIYLKQRDYASAVSHLEKFTTSSASFFLSVFDQSSQTTIAAILFFPTDITDFAKLAYLICSLFIIIAFRSE